EKCDLVKMLETVAMPGTVGSNTKSSRRRRLYGKPGSFRDKPYGIEWRTPDCMCREAPLFLRIKKVVDNFDTLREEILKDSHKIKELSFLVHKILVDKASHSEQLKLEFLSHKVWRGIRKNLPES